MNHKLIASGMNENMQIFLDCWDYRTYSVSIHRKGQETIHEDYDSMTDATLRFFRVCRENGIEHKKA